MDNAKNTAREIFDSIVANSDAFKRGEISEDAFMRTQVALWHAAEAAGVKAQVRKMDDRRWRR